MSVRSYICSSVRPYVGQHFLKSCNTNKFQDRIVIAPGKIVWPSGSLLTLMNCLELYSEKQLWNFFLIIWSPPSILGISAINSSSWLSIDTFLLWNFPCPLYYNCEELKIRTNLASWRWPTRQAPCSIVACLFKLCGKKSFFFGYSEVQTYGH